MATTQPPRWIEYVPLDEIQVAKWNPKEHDAQLIGDSIGEHGFVNAVVVDERTGDLVAGHGRRDDLLARRAAGEDPPEGVMLGDDDVWLVPVQRGWRSKSKRQAEKYLVADNATTAAAGWDAVALAPRLEDWATARGGLKGSGFTPAAAKDLLQAAAGGEGTRPDPEVPDQPKRPVSKAGDVWLLGDGCRLMCGDSTSSDDMAKLLAGDQADLVVTSPPYNVDVQYEEHDDQTLPWPEYRAFLSQVATVCIGVMASGRAFVWNVGVPAGAYHYRQAVMLEDTLNIRRATLACPGAGQWPIEATVGADRDAFQENENGGYLPPETATYRPDWQPLDGAGACGACRSRQRVELVAGEWRMADHNKGPVYLTRFGKPLRSIFGQNQQLGTHPAPFWIGRDGKLKVCDRHRSQYEERADEFGPFGWQPAEPGARAAG